MDKTDQNKHKTTVFGSHLTIDGYECKRVALLNDVGCMFDLLEVLPTKIGMKKIAPPSIVRFPGNDKKDPGGLSGFIMIAESHISIHTVPKRKFVSIDVYSCKKFDPDFVVKYFKEKYAIQKIEKHFIKRGKKYPLS